MSISPGLMYLRSHGFPPAGPSFFLAATVTRLRSGPSTELLRTSNIFEPSTTSNVSLTYPGASLGGGKGRSRGDEGEGGNSLHLLVYFSTSKATSRRKGSSGTAAQTTIAAARATQRKRNELHVDPDFTSRSRQNPLVGHFFARIPFDWLVAVTSTSQDFQRTLIAR